MDIDFVAARYAEKVRRDWGEKTREEKSLLGYTILPLAMSLCCSAKLMVARQK